MIDAGALFAFDPSFPVDEDGEDYGADGMMFEDGDISDVDSLRVSRGTTDILTDVESDGEVLFAGRGRQAEDRRHGSGLWHWSRQD